MQKVEAKSSCFLHQENPFTINLKETDVYTLDSFETLQDQRFREGMDYYICMVTQGNRTYLVDASNFVKHCIKARKIVNNPVTNLPVEALEVYVSSKEKPDFKLYMKGEEVLNAPNHLPILWSDPSRKKEHRLVFMLDYGKHFETSDLEKTIQVYEQAAEQGSALAKLRLGILYSKQGQKQTAVSFFNSAASAKDISVQNILFCAQSLQKLQENKSTFKAYKLAACKGNLIGIGEVIQRLEVGVGVDRNIGQAYEWRTKLPEKWKYALISDFFNYLKGVNYSFHSTDLPE